MIALHQATVGYGDLPLFPPLSGHFASGSLTAVIGVNGAGKSTLLKTIAGLLPLQGGSLKFSPHPPPAIAYLPQQLELDRQFPITVGDLVAMGCWRRSGIFGAVKRAQRQCITEALETVGMTSLVHRPLNALSGGQLQRALFARLLVQQTPLILLDEPFTGIDTATTGLLLRVIEQLHRQGKTLIAVLHDMAMVADHFPQALLLSAQHCRWGTADEVLTQGRVGNTVTYRQAVTP
ncbi:ABC transporter ATP-binding protein [Serratia sp. JUb9]|uniref:metal ABC transporter ATP-binding protein n=1 Tax=Serratia sp. JUb9 TaxID=2724469 RepID=UPI00164EADFD|nr:ABC transporter ATP-binding protein [Serratia sp. JUb9]QNK31505.1 ABC transporter ATP-binding protein [Serratia sp. JUb9]